MHDPTFWALEAQYENYLEDMVNMPQDTETNEAKALDLDVLFGPYVQTLVADEGLIDCIPCGVVEDVFEQHVDPIIAQLHATIARLTAEVEAARLLEHPAQPQAQALAAVGANSDEVLIIKNALHHLRKHYEEDCSSGVQAEGFSRIDKASAWIERLVARPVEQQRLAATGEGE